MLANPAKVEEAERMGEVTMKRLPPIVVVAVVERFAIVEEANT